MTHGGRRFAGPIQARPAATRREISQAAVLQSIKVEFPLFFSSTPAPGSCIGVPVALQGTQITPGLAHLALAAH